MNEDFDELPSTERFTSRVEHYARFRPSYPDELLSLLGKEVALIPTMRISDVGSGTGLLSELFLRNGNSVFGVEPNDKMRAAAERLLVLYPRFTSICGTAESTTLPNASVDGVVVAQAFHWFDGRRAVTEFRRILKPGKPGGFVALIWNVRNIAASPLMAEYERIVHAYGSDFARSGKEIVSLDRLRELFGLEIQSHTLSNHQDLDWPGLLGRLLSASYMPLAGQPGHEQMLNELKRAFLTFQSGGSVRMEYQTRIYLARPS
jgi:SAM-dependent methyltransferase